MNYGLKVNEDLSRAIQELAFQLGYCWVESGKRVMYTSRPIITANPARKNLYHGIQLGNDQLLSVEDFIAYLKGEYTTKRTITIDGKNIEISEESFQELRKQLVNGD